MIYSPVRHIPSIFVKNRPIQFTFFLTRRCNARCDFCFYLSRSEDRSASDPELSLDEIQRVSSSLGSLLWLAFSGGEIFLRHDLADIVDIFYRNNRPALILLPTNGLLPATIREQTEDILRRCPKSTVVVKLSLDGIEQRHDALRGVPGAFRKVLESYRLLEELVPRYGNLELGINTVFCAENQDHVGDVVRYVRGLPAARTHTVSLVRGAVADPSLKQVNLGKYREVASILESDAKQGRGGVYGFRGARLKTAQDIVQRDLIHKTVKSGTLQVPCCAGRLTLVLTESGELYPCESFERRLGNVRKDGYDLPQILRTPHAQRAIREIRDHGCFCTHECYTMMNVLFNPAMYPALVRQYVGLTPERSVSKPATHPAAS